MDDTYYDEWSLCGQDFVNWLKVKSQNSEMTKSYQTMEGFIKVSTGSINTLQVKLVQAWTSNGCTNIK